MVRNLTGAYAIGKRSANLQKVKTFLDGEYEIVGFAQGTGDETGCVIWVCKTKDGQEFRVRPRGTREERQEYFQNGKDYPPARPPAVPVRQCPSSFDAFSPVVEPSLETSLSHELADGLRY